MDDLLETRRSESDTVRRFLTFRVDRQLYALPAEEIAEIIRLPPVARVPQTPKALLGVANLRGSVLPVASVRALLGRDAKPADPGGRAIILGGAAPVALAVDSVDALVSLDAARVETQQAGLAADPGERLRGAFRVPSRSDTAKILDIKALLATAFVQRKRAVRAPAVGEFHAPAPATIQGSADQQMLITFDVAGQEYALSVADVREIVPAPDATATVPHAEALVLGVATFRDRLLPLLSLRGLLGFAPAGEATGREKVIVTAVAGAEVGLVVDRMRAIVRAGSELIDSVPTVLAARTGGEATIKAIYRGEGGRRLISILTPDQLFREDVMARLREQGHLDAPSRPEIAAGPGNDAQFLVFKLDEEEFGLPIASIDEVSRVPERVARVPKVPKFLEGVINLRGEVLPVVDQRRRFDMPKFAGAPESRRLIVVRSDRHRAGLIVDSVSEVLRAPADAVEPAPDLTEEMSRLVHGVINLHTAGRIVLLLDPAELLSRAERGLLDAFDTAAALEKL